MQLPFNYSRHPTLKTKEIIIFSRFYRPLAIFALVASGAPGLTPTVRHTVLNVSCVSAPTFDGSYTKITNIGNFTVVSPDSVVEVTYQGRVNVDTLTGTTGSVFELRVDDLPSAVGRARAHINTIGGQGEYVTFSGAFSGLEPGTHTVSMWVRTSQGNSGAGGRIDPGC